MHKNGGGAKNVNQRKKEREEGMGLYLNPLITRPWGCIHNLIMTDNKSNHS
jgi:hypothetical protein